MKICCELLYLLFVEYPQMMMMIMMIVLQISEKTWISDSLIETSLFFYVCIFFCVVVCDDLWLEQEHQDCHFFSTEYIIPIWRPLASAQVVIISMI